MSPDIYHSQKAITAQHSGMSSPRHESTPRACLSAARVNSIPADTSDRLLAHSIMLACRPELQARHTAFKRGSAYLERYCLLIAFTAYLEAAQRTGADMTFEEWMAARPDVGQARDAILENPAGEPRAVEA